MAYTYWKHRSAGAYGASLSEADLEVAERAWEQHWAAVRPVELTAAVERHAGTLARSYALRGAGAVHLASALAIGDPDLTAAVWGRRRHVTRVVSSQGIDELICAQAALPTMTITTVIPDS